MDSEISFDSWYKLLKLHSIEEAQFVRRNLLNKTFNTTENTFFKLLDIKQLLVLQQLPKAEQLLSTVNPEDLSSELKYYYYLFLGDYHLLKQNYQFALQQFEAAETYLAFVQHPLEEAEYHYKVGSAFYYLNIPSISKIHFEESVKQFNRDNSFRLRKAHGFLGLGLTEMAMEHYQSAEKYLFLSSRIIQEENHSGLLATVRHNLGLLFYHQHRYADAFFYLKKAMNQIPPLTRLPNLYAIADALYQMENYELAQDYYAEGFMLSKRENNLVYQWRFAMLYKKMMEPDNFEAVWEQGISYFQSCKAYKMMRSSSKVLAEHYCRTNQPEKAVKFYQLASAI